MKNANGWYLPLCLLMLLAGNAVAQKSKPQKKAPTTKTATPKTVTKTAIVKPSVTHDETEDEKKVRDMIAFLEYMLNTLGAPGTSARDKDVLVTESYLKVFRDDKVQIEDDLDEDRQVITNKNVTAYLKDVDFFFTDVRFEFVIDKIEKGENGDKLFYRVFLKRNMTGTTAPGKSINNASPRFVEVNYDPQTQDLKIASIYTHEIDQREAVTNWWKQLSLEWQTIFREKLAGKRPAIHAGDSLSFEDIQTIISFDSLDIRNNHYIRNIDPLARLVNLTSLNLSGTSVDDISALRNLTELTHLDISNTKTQDLSSLRYSAKLVRLDINYTAVNDLSIVQKLPNLKQMNLSFTPLSDLGPLRNALLLTQLNLSHTAITDLSPLQSLTHLTSLTASTTPLRDVTALKTLKLEFLNIDSTAVSNVEPLATQTDLVLLHADNTKIADIKPLQKLPNLTRIYCDKTAIDRASADAFMAINPKVLVVFDTQDLITWWSTLSDDWRELLTAASGTVTNPDKDALATITNLDSINLAGKRVEELEAMRKLLKVRVLIATGTGISDLSPLKEHRQIEYLDISETDVTDISVLEQFSRLKIFRADKSKIQSIYPLYSLPSLQRAYTDQTAIHDITAKEFLDRNPKCLLVYKTIHLARWWSKLPVEWQTVFTQSLGTDTTRENLHRLVELNAFHFKDAPVNNLSALSEFMRLEDLNFAGTSITDLTPLGDHQWLKILHATSSPLQNIAVLSQLAWLTDIDLSNTPIDELKVFTNMEGLKTLNCAGTQIRKLDPLSTIPTLESLDCSNTQVRNLDPVSQKSLKFLKCYNTKVSTREIEAFKTKNPECNVVYYR